jgi:hypothetical protein
MVQKHNEKKRTPLSNSQVTNELKKNIIFLLKKQQYKIIFQW